MNAKDRYDSIINYIEEQAEKIEIPADVVADKVCKKLGLGYRDMNSVIQFMAGTTLLDYIRERKLIASYNYLVSGNRFDVRTAYEIAGYESQQGYNKRFAKRFGMSPKKAFKRKALDLCTPASTWSYISCDNSILTDEKGENAAVDKETVFGLSTEQYELVSEVFELSVKYGFEKVFSQFACAFAEKNCMSLADAFRYTDSLRRSGIGVEDVDDDVITPEEELSIWGYDPYYISMFFEWGYSVSDAFDIEEKLCREDDEILTLDKKMVADFLSLDECDDIDFDMYESAYNYYNQKIAEIDKKPEWDLYLRHIIDGWSKEEAFE